MGTPLYTTDIIPLTSRPTLTVMDDGDYFAILDTSTGKISKILRTDVQKALSISYDNATSGLTATQVQAALDELVVNLGSSDSAISALGGRLDILEADELTEGSIAYDIKQSSDALKGTGYTEGSLKTHEDRLDTLEGDDDTEGSVAKTVKDAVADLAGTGRTTETVKKNADDISTLNAPDTTEGSVAKAVKDGIDTRAKKYISVAVAYTDSDGTEYTYKDIVEGMNELTLINGGAWRKERASEVIEFVSDYANFTNPTLVTYLRYEHDIAVVSGEPIYVATAMKNNTLGTTVWMRTNFATETGISFGLYYDFKFLSTIVHANMTGMSEIGYQLNSNVAATDLSMSFKQSYAIKLSNFVTPPTQTELDEIIQTYLLYKDEESMVEKAKYAQYLKGVKYIDDSLYVEHIDRTNLSQFIIHRQTKHGDENTYLSTQFQKQTIASINSDVYHLQRVYLSTKIGDSFFEQSATSMVLGGEWECSLQEVGAVDFIGGSAHGDEVMAGNLILLLDGKLLPEIGNYIEAGSSIEILCNSQLNRCDTPLEIVANHTKHYIITKEKMNIFQRVNWLDTMNLTTSYLCMLPINRDIEGVVVSNQAFFDEDFVSEGLGINSVYKYNSNQVTYYNNSVGHQFTARVKIVRGEYDFMRVTNSTNPNYNKLYVPYKGTSTGKTVNNGDVWEFEVEYSYDYKGLKE
jgi:hypothetical protein